MSPGFTIAIPTYNRASLLAGSLESLFRLEVPPGAAVDVLVVDNNCSDDTAAVVERFARSSPWPLRRVVETNQGLTHSRNRALSDAANDVVVFFDDDVMVSPGWLLGCREAIDGLGADCVVGPVTPRWLEPPPPYLTPRVLDSLGSWYSRKGDEPLVLPARHSREIPGCNFAVKRSVALEIGGFDPALGRAGRSLLAGEDTEFGIRLGRAGKRVVYHPACALEHLITAEKFSRAYLRRRWYGLGATERRLAGTPASRGWLPRRALALLRTYLDGAIRKFRRQDALAFQRELEALRILGFIRS